MNDFAWLHNPILVKCARVRLRRHQVVPLLIATFIVMASIFWGAVLLGLLGKGVIHAFLGFQLLFLLLAGTSQVSTAVAQSADSGMLDFHRIAPLPPSEVALGFLLGGPIREYLLAACLIPFELVCCAFGELKPLALMVLLVAMLVNALLFHALAMAEVLMVKKGTRFRRAAIILAVVLYWSGASAAMSYGPALLTVLPIYRSLFELNLGVPAQPTFYGLPFPVFVQCLLFQIPLFAFTFAVSVRKLRRERTHSLSKPGAALLLVTVAFLLLGSIWHLPLGGPGGPPQFANIGTGVAATLLITTTIVAILLVPIVTPDAGDFQKGLRRALRAGRRRPLPWDDFAVNSLVVGVFVLTILAATGIALLSQLQAVVPPAGLWLGFLGAALLVVNQGCALQWMLLAHGRKAPSYFGFYLFLVWGVPLLIGGVAACGGLAEVGSYVSSLSPLAALPLAAMGAIDPRLILSLSMSGLLLVVSLVQLRMTLHRTESQAQVRPGVEAVAQG